MISVFILTLTPFLIVMTIANTPLSLSIHQLTVLSFIHTNSFNLAEVGVLVPSILLMGFSLEMLNLLPKVLQLIREGSQGRTKTWVLGSSPPSTLPLFSNKFLFIPISGLKIVFYLSVLISNLCFQRKTQRIIYP